MKVGFQHFVIKHSVVKLVLKEILECQKKKTNCSSMELMKAKFPC